MKNGKKDELPSFWIPSLTPEYESQKLKKPSNKICCPMSGKPLSFKQLTAVNFKVNPNCKGQDSKKPEYVCAVSGDVLNSTVPCAVIKPTGAVVTMEVVKKLIKKDMMDPLTGQKLRDDDIIELRRMGTGFTSGGGQLEAVKHNPAMD